ncbi:MAG: PH domain-containing protein [Thermoguttaceae bacterium]|jgi:membrane protein YdbS with pleckstrin-like domain
MVCPQCGAEIVAEAIFCHKCGHRIPEQDIQGDPGHPSTGEGETPAPEVTPAEKFKAAAAGLDSSEEQERELWRGSYSSKAMIGAWCLSALISIGLLIIGLIWVPWRYWAYLAIAIIFPWIYNQIRFLHRRMSVSYMLTNQRFIHESGILRRVTDRIEVIEIDDITFEQGVIERIVGVGTIKISSSDRTHPELILPGIENVSRVSGLIDDTRRAERRRRGLHIENI